MKKFYTFLVLVLVGFVGNAQIVNVPDANFVANLFASSSSQDVASTQAPIYNAGTGIWSMPTSYVDIDSNGDGQIQVSEAQAIKCLNITGYNVNDLTGIEAFINLEYLVCSNNVLSILNVQGLSNLKHLDCVGNQLTSLNLSGLSNLKNLTCVFNQLTSLNVSGLSNLNQINCSSNNLTSLNVSGLSSLQLFSCQNNDITSLNLSGLLNLQSIDCSDNLLTSLNLSGLTNLQRLYTSYNQLTTIDLFGLINLKLLHCSFNQLTNLNITYNGLLDRLDCPNNQLTSLFIKNNCPTNWILLNFLNNPNLVYICADEADFTYVQNKINTAGYALTCHVNSYCSFTPSGIFYTLQGNTRFDTDSNGCNVSDIIIPNQRFTTNGTFSGSFISNISGSYFIPVATGSFTIIPTFENPGYFTSSPSSATVSFPSTVSPYTQNFCITANGTHNDLEVTLLPIGTARPGFDANYKVIYKNKGTQVQSGSVNLTFNDASSDLVSSTPIVNNQVTNSLTWNFSNLQPFQTREITITLNVNSPMETPAVNGGDILNYTATVTGVADETPNDNSSTLNQTVVNSFDPNDKTCVEGTTITPSMVGQYVHYVIRFENTGTANAQNIVVKDMIDTAKYDVSSLVPLSGSASYVTRITNTNQVEFIFQNINLPFDDANNDGYIAFKIKTKPTLVVGNTFSNSANIYFDYNFPIVTNTCTTTIATLGNQDFDFGSVFTLSPVPAKNSLTITTKQDVIMSSVSIYNTLGQLVQVDTNPNENIDVSGLQSGSYFIRISSDKGSATGKFIKE